jgi:DNA-binding MarR family transcriptional regulator
MNIETITKTQQQFLTARKHKLNLSQAITILLLEGEFMTTNHINRKIGLTSGAMTGILDKLESMRLIFRKHSQHDRRVITIGLTDRGREVAHDIANPH